VLLVSNLTSLTRLYTMAMVRAHPPLAPLFLSFLPTLLFSCPLALAPAQVPGPCPWLLF